MRRRGISSSISFHEIWNHIALNRAKVSILSLSKDAPCHCSIFRCHEKLHLILNATRSAAKESSRRTHPATAATAPYPSRRRRITGAVSRIKVIATNPTAVAKSMYQAGASALPVAWMSQVTTSCAVPPKLAIATA
jgi:hypothetical protein